MQSGKLWEWRTTLRSPLDLLEARHQLRVLRSLHSREPRATILINRLLVKIGHLHEPESEAHQKHLQHLITKTVRAVEEIVSRSSD